MGIRCGTDFFVTPMRSSGSRVDIAQKPNKSGQILDQRWKILFFVIFTKLINSVQTRCIVKGEAQKSPFFWRFSGVFDFLRIACSLGTPQDNLYI